MLVSLFSHSKKIYSVSMSIYIEFVIIDNLLFTSMICFASYVLIKQKPVYLRIAIASVVGTIVAIFYPFVQNIVLLILIKILLCLTETVILFRKHKVLGCLSFLCCTFALGGAQFCIGYAYFGSVEAALTLPISDLPLSLLVFPPFVLTAVGVKFISKLRKKNSLDGFRFVTELTVYGQKVKIEGMVDTGNAVEDVIFLSEKKAFEVFSPEVLIKMFASKQSIIVTTASGNKKIAVSECVLVLYSGKDEHILSQAKVGICPLQGVEALLPLSVLYKEYKNEVA